MVFFLFLLSQFQFWIVYLQFFVEPCEVDPLFSPDMEHFHHRLMAKGLSHGKAVLAMWAMAFCCSLVAIAAAFGKGDQLFAIFVFFGLGGFILLVISDIFVLNFLARDYLR